MDSPPTGPIPIDGSDAGDDREPEQVGETPTVEGHTQPDTIPDLEGSDPALPGAEESPETADFPDMQPLYLMRVKMPSVKQQRETTRSRLALIALVVALLAPIALILWHVAGADIEVAVHTATIALIVILGFYFPRPPRRRGTKRSRK